MRLESLVARYELPADCVSRFTVLLDRLQATDAPTTVHDRQAALRVHLADALTGLEVDDVRRAGTLADLGAGAGIPGLVLAAALPGTQVTLVESVGRKAQFSAAVAEAMELGNVRVVTARAEDWQDGIGTCDVVTARALAVLPVLCEYAAPLLREGGVLVAWKGALEEDERASGERAAAELGLSAPDVRAVAPYRGSRQHHLVICRKDAPTPPRYPRRAGMAVKRPLGVRPRG